MRIAINGFGRIGRLVFQAPDRAIAAYIVSDSLTRVAIIHNLASVAKTVSVTDAASIAGFLSAAASAVAPSLQDAALELPPYSTALLLLSDQ
jgi:glyceraldehyde-3-phosphate dehydrogenase/erythrose-4-phosphate dehydrogenase